MPKKEHAVKVPNQPLVLKTATGSIIKLHQVPAAVDNLCWLLEYEAQKVALVDGPSAQEIIDYLSENQLQLTHILNTHTHGDHIGVNRDLSKRGLLQNLEVWGSAKAPSSIPGLSKALCDGDQINLGELSGSVMLTEGHLNGHISFVFDLNKPVKQQEQEHQERSKLDAEESKDYDLIECLLFCGDTLFTGGCGYVFDGPMSLMAQSLDKLASLPKQTLVCCAHEYTLDNLHFALSVEPNNAKLQQRAKEVILLREKGHSTVPSTLAEELESNPFLRSHSLEIIKNIGVDPEASRSLIFEKTRRLKDRKAYRKQTLDEFLT